MTDGYVQVQPDSSGKKIDNSELDVGTNTVERQRINVADSEDAEGLAPVLAEDPERHDYGLAVRIVPHGEDANLTHELLAQILDKLDQLVILMTFKG